MKWSNISVLCAAAVLLPLTLLAQVRNESLANGVIAARQKQAAMLHEYNWNCRTEIIENGKMQDLRIELVTVGPDGHLQRSLLNDEEGRLPIGLFRKAIATGERKQLEDSVKKLARLLDEYTLPSAGSVINFLSAAQLTPITTPQGGSVLQAHGLNVVKTGDSMTLTLDGHTLDPMQIQVSAPFEDGQVSVTATFQTLKSGLNHMQFATAEIPSKGVTVMIHNFDYVPNN